MGGAALSLLRRGEASPPAGRPTTVAWVGCFVLRHEGGAAVATAGRGASSPARRPPGAGAHGGGALCLATGQRVDGLSVGVRRGEGCCSRVRGPHFGAVSTLYVHTLGP